MSWLPDYIDAVDPPKKRPKKKGGKTASGRADVSGGKKVSGKGTASTKSSSGGRTESEASLAQNLSLLGNKVSPTNLKVAPAIDPALLPNATTGLSKEGQEGLTRALTGTKEGLDLAEMTGLPGAARAAIDLAGNPYVDLPVVGGIEKPSTLDAIDLALIAAGVLGAAGAVGRAGRAAKTAREAEQAAKVAGKESKAAKVAAGRKFSQKEVDRLERAAARRRIKARRAKMSRKERAADRAQDAKTRAQAALYNEAYRIALGAGGAGGTAYGAREIAKRSSTKRAAAGAIATEGARKALTSPGRAATSLNRAALSPGIVPVTGALPADETVRNVASLPYQMAAATVEDPAGVAEASWRSGRDMLLGAPKAVYETFTNPAEAWEMMKEDYVRRYKPLIEGDFRYFRDQVAENGGLTPYALDALIAAPPAGKVVGSAGRAGALGKTVEQFMVKERPTVLREVGSVPVEQTISKNAVGVTAQRTMDAIRARRTRAAANRAQGGRGMADAFAEAATEADAIAPIFRKHAQARSVAARKGRTRAINLAQQGRLMKNFGLRMSQLSREQARAVKWGLALGIRTPEAARAELTARIAAIQEARAPETQFGKLDNIPEIEEVIRDADKIFTPEFADTLDEFRRIEKRLAVGDPTKGPGRMDPALDIEQATLRRVAQQAEHMGIERFDGETNVEFVSRVREAAQERGLAEAGYFPSELSRRNRFSQMATGGTRHSERTKAYTGKLFEQGIENNDPAVLLRGLQRNIKRRNSWQMVSEIYERNSIPWSRGPNGDGMSQKQILEEAGKRGIDESSFVLANPGLMRRAGNADMEPGTAQVGSAGVGNPYFDELMGAIRDSTRATGAADFEDLKGWYAVPTAVLDELESSMRQGKIARGADVAMSKMSGYLLAGNTGWLGFQTISTALQAGMAGVTPLDWALAQAWFIRESRNARPRTGARTGIRRRRAPKGSREIMGNPDLDTFQAYAGITQAGDYANPPHMGASIQGGGMIAGAVEAQRLFREGKWGQALRSANPIQAWFKLSQIPENANRRALAYKLLKKDAVKRMNVNVKKTDAAINRITASMKLDPDGQIKGLLKDQKALEDMATGLADFLGDYQTFTAVERAVLKRSIPFYSWMRFATKFALFTLPSKHPVATGLAYQLGRLESEELREVLGDAMGWALGKLFLGDPADEDTPFIDIYRGNPLLSALVEFEDPRDLMSFLPPYAALIGNQIWGRNYFTRSDLTVDGETMPRSFTQRGLLNELQIGLNQYLSLFTPYRVGAEMAFQGTPQTDDAFPVSLGPLGGPEPKRYAPGSGMETKAREEREFSQDGGAGGVAWRRLLPFLPQDSNRLRQQGKYINAETARELRDIQEYQQRNPGAPASGAEAIMDEITNRMQSESPAQDIMDKIKERIGS